MRWVLVGSPNGSDPVDSEPSNTEAGASLRRSSVVSSTDERMRAGRHDGHMRQMAATPDRNTCPSRFPASNHIMKMRFYLSGGNLAPMSMDRRPSGLMEL